MVEGLMVLVTWLYPLPSCLSNTCRTWQLLPYSKCIEIYFTYWALPCIRWHQTRCLLPSPVPNSATHCCPPESTSGWLEAEQELKDRPQLSRCQGKQSSTGISSKYGKKGHVIKPVVRLRDLLVLAETAALAGPWPMLLKPFTVNWYRVLPSRPVKIIVVSFFTVLCFFPASCCSISFQ